MNIAINSYQLILALTMGAFIGGLAGYIGSLMLTKRMSLMGGALGHLALPGISLALLYGFDVSLGALIFLLTGITLIWLLEWYTGLPTEALTAVVFASAVAISFLYLPHKEYQTALIGSIGQLSIWTVLILCGICILVFLIIQKLYPTLVLASISPDFVTIKKGNAQAFNLIYLLSIAITIALGVRIVGGLMTAALVAIPASTAKNISNTMKQYAYLSLILGAISCILGVVGSLATNTAPGPLIIIASSSLFALSLIFKK